MDKKYHIYRAILHLYPKSFRQHYGEEMVSVLDDLLSEHTDALGKCMVWLRVGSELPFSIAQENIDNLGGKTMNAVVTRKNRRIIAAIVICLAILIGIYAATVLRPGLSLRFVNIVYGKSMRNELTQQSQLLGDPVEELAGKESNKNHGCSVYMSPTEDDQIVCDTSRGSYVKIKDIGTPEEVRAKVEHIESQLKRHGYTLVNSNDVTLKNLIEGTYKGQDYSPDAFYRKNDGKYQCAFDTSIAYANPAEPAVNTWLSCTRSFNL